MQPRAKVAPGQEPQLVFQPRRRLRLRPAGWTGTAMAPWGHPPRNAGTTVSETAHGHSLTYLPATALASHVGFCESVALPGATGAVAAVALWPGVPAWLCRVPAQELSRLTAPVGQAGSSPAARPGRSSCEGPAGGGRLQNPWRPSSLRAARESRLPGASDFREALPLAAKGSPALTTPTQLMPFGELPNKDHRIRTSLPSAPSSTFARTEQEKQVRGPSRI